jgi:hypothetical protein
MEFRRRVLIVTIVGSDVGVREAEIPENVVVGSNASVISAVADQEALEEDGISDAVG